MDAGDKVKIRKLCYRIQIVILLIFLIWAKCIKICLSKLKFNLDGKERIDYLSKYKKLYINLRSFNMKPLYFWSFACSRMPE